MFELDEEQQLVARTVREFVDREVIPVASGMEHRDEYPDALVETMKALGLFGLNVPEEYGGSDVDYTTFAIVFEELSRGWMGLAGILGTHLVLCDVLARYGTDGSEAAFPAAARERRTSRRHLPLGTERGHRPAGDLDDGDAVTATRTSSTARRCG